MIFVIVLKLFRIPGGGGVLNKCFHWEALPRGPTPYPFIYHFSRKGILFIYLILLFDFIIWFYYFAKHNELQAE